MKLTPVSYDPFAEEQREPTLTPVDYDPFAPAAKREASQPIRPGLLEDTSTSTPRRRPLMMASPSRAAAPVEALDNAARDAEFTESSSLPARIGYSVERGIRGADVALGGTLVDSLRQQIDDIDRRGYVHLGYNKHDEEIAIRDPIRVANWREKLLRELGKNASATAEQQKRIADIPTRPATRDVGKAETFAEGFAAFARDPVGVVADIGVQSGVQMLPALLATAASKNPAVGAAAIGLTSGGIEYGSGIIDYLAQAGVDTTDPKALEAAVNNPALMEAASKHASTRGAIIGTVDAATMGLASKTLVPSTLVKSRLAREGVNALGVQPVTQAAAGAAGESAAQLATEGRITRPGDVLLEAVGEGATAPAEVLAFGARALRPVPRIQTGDPAVDAGAEAARSALERAQLSTPASPQAQDVQRPGVGDWQPIAPESFEAPEPDGGELFANGRRVRYRGNPDEMRARLEAAGLPQRGYAFTEDDKVSGLYFASSLKPQLDSILAGAHTGAPVNASSLLAETSQVETSVTPTEATTESLTTPEVAPRAVAANPPKALGTTLDPRRRTLDEFEARLSAFATSRNLDDASVAELRKEFTPPEDMDPVTGLHQKATFQPTLKAAQEIARSGKPVQYVEADLTNLGGLNERFGTAKADPHLRSIAEILKAEAEGAGAEEAVVVRKGGDEFSVVLVGATTEQAERAMDRARARASEYASANGLADLPHKKGGQPGVGLHYGIATIEPNADLDDIRSVADVEVEARKKGAPYRGQRRQVETLGTGERPARAIAASVGTEAGGSGGTDRSGAYAAAVPATAEEVTSDGLGTRATPRIDRPDAGTTSREVAANVRRSGDAQPASPSALADDAQSGRAPEAGRAEVDEVREDETEYSEVRALPEATSRTAVEQSRQAGDIQSARPVSGRIDVLSNEGAKAPNQPRLAQLAKQVAVGTFRTGITKVAAWIDAAHIVAPIRKSPQEVMAAVVLDKDGKPLSVIRAHRGTASSADVEPWSLVGAVTAIPGARKVYFAHNHPSGNPKQSEADKRLTAKLEEMLEDTGIEARGMIVVSPGTRKATFYGAGTSIESVVAPAARTKGEVPVTERQLRRIGKLIDDRIIDEQSAKEIIAEVGEQSGVLLLTTQNDPVGVIPMTPQEMNNLRTGDPATGYGRLLTLAQEANAPNAIVFGPSAGALNTAKALHRSTIKVLDTFADGKSTAREAPWEYGSFTSKRESPAKRAGDPKQRIAAVRDQLIERFGNRFRRRALESGLVNVVTSQDVEQIVPRAERAAAQNGEIKGLYAGGKVYLVADALEDSDVIPVTMHELGVHALHLAKDAGEWQGALNIVRKQRNRNPDVTAAYAKAEAANTPAEHLDEEALAYLIEAKPGHSVAERVINAIKRLLNRLGIALSVIDADIEALQNAAAKAVRDFASGKFTVRAREQSPKYHRAYHGSAADFDKFDASKMGTGEGAQAFGAGLYFSGKREIAEHYRKTVSQKSLVDAAREAYDEFDSPDEAADALIANPQLTAAQKELVEALSEDGWLGFDYPHQAIRAAFREPDAYDMSDRTKAALAKQGRVYEVELAPTEDQYLDWDRPLSEQSAQVRDALNLSQADDRTDGGVFAGQQITLAPQTGGEFYKRLAKQLGGQEQASAQLAERGVPGIRYKDATARGTDRDSFNYVVFSDAAVDVKAKYSKRVNRDGTLSLDAAGVPPTRVDAATAPPEPREPEQPQGLADVPAIESHRENLARLRIFWDSASDVLRRQPAFRDLANAIDGYYDGRRERLGRVNAELRPVTKAASKGDLEAFRRFQEHVQNHRPNDARKEVDEGTENLRAMVAAWQTVADFTGKENQELGVKVFDVEQGQWRPIGRVRNFFPRVLKPEFQRAIHAPHKHPADWNRFVSILKANGRIATADDAARYVAAYFDIESANDYFAGIEKARKDPLPEEVYDYSWKAALDYGRRWADRASQIESFGQKLGHEGKDLFDLTIGRTMDERTRTYIAQIQKSIYQTRSKDPVTKAAAMANTFATGVQLGNPVSAGLNAIGGAWLNTSTFGVTRSLRGFFELRHASQAIADAIERGIIVDDYYQIATDADQADVPHYLRTLTSGLLKVSGYDSAETFARVHAMLTGKAYLRAALKHWNSNIESGRSKRAIAWFQRNGFDYRVLALEHGNGPETDRFLRYAANVTQGSYDLAQTPVWVDAPVGRFFMKYNKWGTQLSRGFWKNNLKPFVDSIKGGELIRYQNKRGELVEERVRTFMPLLRFFATAVPFGWGVMVFRGMFGMQSGGPDDDELRRALDDDDTALFLALAAERSWHSLLAIGALGFFNNPVQITDDIADRQRFKAPWSPPAVAPPAEVGKLALKAVDQGTLTASDLDETARNIFSLYRTGKRISARTLRLVTEDVEWANLEAAKLQRDYARKMTRRFAEEQNIEAKKRAPEMIGATALTPLQQAVHDALLMGRAEQAKQLVAAHMRDPDKGPKSQAEAESVLASLKGSVQSHQPVRVAVSPSEWQRRQFFAWARDRMTQEGFERISAIDKTYRDAAEASGIWNPRDGAEEWHGPHYIDDRVIEANIEGIGGGDPKKQPWTDAQRAKWLKRKGWISASPAN